MCLGFALNTVQFAAHASARDPNVLDELESNLMLLEKQASSLFVRSHGDLEQHWAYKPSADLFIKAKAEIETLSRKQIAVDQDQRFAERILTRYLGLESRLYLVYARIAHARSGLENQFSFDHLAKFNLKIAKDSANVLRMLRPHNIRHVDSRTLEVFLTQQDKQLAEFAALMNPRTSEEYLAALQFSAIRSGIVNKWAIDQAYAAPTTENVTFFPTQRFLSFRDLQGKTISAMQAYQELNADLRLEGFLKLKPEIQAIIAKVPLTNAVRLDAALLERLMSLPGFFKQNRFNSREDNQEIVERLIKELGIKYASEWDRIAGDVIETASMVGDFATDSRYPQVVDRLLESSYSYMNNLISFYLTKWMAVNGFISSEAQSELEANEKIFDAFKPEWVAKLRPKLIDLVKSKAQSALRETRLETHHEKMEFIRTSVLQDIWIWNILLESKNNESAVVGKIKQVPNDWKLVDLKTPQDAEYYFFRSYQGSGIPFVDKADQEWLLKFFAEFKKQKETGNLKSRLRKFYYEYTKKTMEQALAEFKANSAKTDQPPPHKFSDPKGELVRIFHFEDKDSSSVLTTIEEYQTFAEAKREELVSKAGVLRLLRTDALSASRIEREHQKQVAAYDKFMNEVEKYRERYSQRELFRPELQKADDLLLSLVRSWKENPNALITDAFNAEMKAAYDGARTDSAGKLEKLFSIHDLAQSKFNQDHRLILQSTERVRQTFIQGNEVIKKLDESLMKETRTSGERLNDFLNEVVMYVFYAILVVGAATLVVASDGAMYPLLQGLLSAGLMTINIMGVANVITRTAVDFYIVPPQLEYQREYANFIATSSRQEVQQGDVTLSARDEEKLEGLDQKGQTLERAIHRQEEQRGEKKLGVVWSVLDMTGVGEVIKPLRPITKAGRALRYEIIKYKRAAR